MSIADEGARVEPRPGGLARGLLGLVLFQLAAVAVALFVPFGFDHPSALGLDFEHFLVLLSLYGLAALLGIIAAARRRRWSALALQLALPAVLALLVFSGRLAI